MAACGAPWPGLIALSGGGDSVALMLCLRDWAREEQLPPPCAAIVDHGLRPGSAAEAGRVANWARDAGIAVSVLTRNGPVPGGDIEAFARDARYRLLGEHALALGLKAVYVGHNADDLAENFLIRLGRGSGVDGLAAMPPLSPYPVPGFAGLCVVRPLLGLTREALRDDLAARGQGWVDDPMNEDERFTRVRIRQAWPMLQALGIGKARLVATAEAMARARSALEAAADDLAARCVQESEAGMLIDAAALAAAPKEIGLRVLATVLMRVSRHAYRPRLERLNRLYDALCHDGLQGGRTLHGCRIARAPKRLSPDVARVLVQTETTTLDR